jgi:hypothetical protein
MDLSIFVNEVDIPLSADFLNSYDSTDGTGNNGIDAIPISNMILQKNLNAKLLNGNNINQIGIKDGTHQINLNADKLGKSDGTGLDVGFNLNNYSLKDSVNNPPTLNQGLNAKMLYNKQASGYADISHVHTLDDINDSSNFKKVVFVNSNNQTSNNSFVNSAFTLAKQAHSGNDANSTTIGRQKHIKLVTGLFQIPNNGTFTINFPISFVRSPFVAVKLVNHGASTWSYDASHAYIINLSSYTVSSVDLEIIRLYLASYNGYSNVGFNDTKNFSGKYIFYIAVGEVV